MDEPTAWEDINPMMALAPLGGQHYVSSDLRPATSDQFRDELEACLALVVPVGMDEAARAEWLAVAWATLSHLPADLLRVGCAKARQSADHPAKIVPIITAETLDDLERRRERPRIDYAPQIAAPEVERCTPEQAREIMAEFGLRRNPLETTMNSDG